MPGVNYAINSCSCSRTAPGALTLEEKTVAVVTVITQDRVIDDNLKRQVKS